MTTIVIYKSIKSLCQVIVCIVFWGDYNWMIFFYEIVSYWQRYVKDSHWSADKRHCLLISSPTEAICRITRSCMSKVIYIETTTILYSYNIFFFTTVSIKVGHATRSVPCLSCVRIQILPSSCIFCENKLSYKSHLFHSTSSYFD